MQSDGKHTVNADVYELLKGTAKRLFLNTRWGRHSQSYSMRKFPELKQGFVENQIGVFQRILGDFDGVELEKVDKDLFHLK